MRLLLHLTIGAMLVLIAPAVEVSAAEPTYPELGTWDFNPAKSSSTGRLARSAWRTYERQRDAIRMTAEMVDQEGKRHQIGYTAKYDGKDYPVVGDAARTVAFTPTGPLTLEGHEKRGGKVISTFTRTISEDGKVLTLTFQGKNQRGEPFKNVLVFDRRAP